MSQREQGGSSDMEVLPSRRMTLSDTLQRTTMRTIPHATLLTLRHSPHLLPSLFEVGSDDAEVIAERLRNTAVPLIHKRALYSQFDDHGHRSGLNCCMQGYYSCLMSFQRFSNFLGDLWSWLEPWKAQHKRISGKFGSGVLSYFVLLRSLLVLNLIPLILLGAFVFLPQILLGKKTVDEANPSCNAWSWLSFDCLSTTLLFYGSYGNQQNKTLNTTSSAPVYDMEYAYFFTVAAVYLALFISFSMNVFRSVKLAPTATGTTMVALTLSGWDYSITSAGGIKLKQSSLKNHITEAVPRKDTKFHIILIVWRIISWTVSLFIIALCCYTLALFCGLLKLGDGELPFNNNMELTTLGAAALPVGIAALNAFVPVLFGLFVKYEHYSSANWAVLATLARSLLLRFSLTATLLYYYMNQWERRDQAFGTGEPYYNVSGSQYRFPILCVETFIGEALYTLALLSFIFILVNSFLFEVLPAIVAAVCLKKSRVEFDIGRNSLELIYLFILSWLATYFSPVSPIIPLIVLPLTFYAKYATVTLCCRPPKSRWETKYMQTIYQTLLLTTLILCTIPYGFVATSRLASPICGPFAETPAKASATLLPELAVSVQEIPMLGSVFTFLYQPGFLVCIFFMLLVGVYFSYIYQDAYGAMSLLLQKQVALEGQDKKFLLRELNSLRGDLERLRNRTVLPSN